MVQEAIRASATAKAGVANNCSSESYFYKKKWPRATRVL